MHKVILVKLAFFKQLANVFMCKKGYMWYAQLLQIILVCSQSKNFILNYLFKILY